MCVCDVCVVVCVGITFLSEYCVHVNVCVCGV